MTMTRSTNRPARGKASPFKGVTPAYADRWHADLYLPGEGCLRLGTFNSEVEAALAYDAAALQLLGPKTFLNTRDLKRITQPIIEGNTALIPTSNGTYFRVDIDDLPKVRQYYWSFRNGYLCGSIGRRKTQLHPLLMGPIPSTLVAVHLNGDPLDCRKENIILAPRSLHVGRRRKCLGATSKYKGVRKTVAGTWSTRLAGRLRAAETPCRRHTLPEEAGGYSVVALIVKKGCGEFE